MVAKAGSGDKWLMLILQLILLYPHQISLDHLIAAHTTVDRRCSPLIYISVRALVLVSVTPVTAGSLMDVTVGCVFLCDGASNCLRVFPAPHLRAVTLS